VAIAQLRQPPGIDPVALTALGMLDIAAAFRGGPEQGMQWLAGRRLQPGKTADHAPARSASTLARNGDFTHVLESLLHIHHNRYRGIDRDGEGTCRRLARQAALARRAARLPETA
jgi:hypothetical protein